MQLCWLERPSDTREAVGSIPAAPTLGNVAESGLWRFPAKEVASQGAPGFKSQRFRHRGCDGTGRHAAGFETRHPHYGEIAQLVRASRS